MSKYTLTNEEIKRMADGTREQAEGHTAAERRYEHGFWVAGYYGNQFTCVRNITTARRYGIGVSKGEERRGIFDTLAAAQEECDRLNGEGGAT